MTGNDYEISLEERVEKIQLSPRYIEAARRMFDQLNISIRKIEKFDDIKNALTGTLQKPSTADISYYFIMYDGGLPRFIIDYELTIMILGDSGDEHSYLFTHEDGAGFVRIGPGGRTTYVFFDCPKGGVEFDEMAGTISKKVEGAWNRNALSSNEFIGIPDYGEKGKIDELWSYVLQVLKEWIDKKEKEMLLIQVFTGLMNGPRRDNE